MIDKTGQVGGSHYKEMSIDVWDVVDTWPVEQRIAFYRGNTLKYLMRMGSKDADMDELGKCRHYLDKLIEVVNHQEQHQSALTKQAFEEMIRVGRGLDQAWDGLS